MKSESQATRKRNTAIVARIKSLFEIICFFSLFFRAICLFICSLNGIGCRAYRARYSIMCVVCLSFYLIRLESAPVLRDIIGSPNTQRFVCSF